MTHAAIQSEIERFFTPEFAARLAEAKCQAYEAECQGIDLPVATFAALLVLPENVTELLLAWNIANANASSALDAMAASRLREHMEVRH